MRLVILICLLGLPSIMLTAGMQIFVSPVVGETYALEVEQSTTIADVKQLLQDVGGFDAVRQQLVFSGLSLIDSRTLADYNIQKESTLDLFLDPLALSFDGPLAWTQADSLFVEFTNGFDQILVSSHSLNGSLDLSEASATQPISIELRTPFGALVDFDPTQSYFWVILDDSGGHIEGFAADKFAFDASEFANPVDGVWSISQGSLVLNYTPVPEPSTYALLFGCLAAALAAVRRRRRD